MDTLTFYQDTVERILKAHAAIPYSQGEISQYVITDCDRTHFLLFNEGWDGKKRVHGCITHVELKNGKIWIHRDGIEAGITDELLEAGILKDQIVLAFHPPYLREHTEYAVA